MRDSIFDDQLRTILMFLLGCGIGAVIAFGLINLCSILSSFLFD